MEVEMTQVTLPDEVVAKLRKAAEQEGTELSELLERAVDYYVAQTAQPANEAEDDQAQKLSWEEQKRRIEEEQQAFEAQHERLSREYVGEHIAMYQGQVVDHDEDGVALHRRIRERFGNQPVLITPVLPEPVQVITVRSPRSARGDQP
jgi:metal-responsive CopG/Arc/MetJ family transcriptional regulator